MDASLKIFNYLNSKGINVNFPNTHTEVVNEPIVVIKDMGQYNQYNSRGVGNTLVHLIIHTTQDNYVGLLNFRDNVKRAMLGMGRLVKPTGFETPILNDDTKKSYTVSIEYEVSKKLLY